MARKEKGSDMFEGTFLTGLTNLEGTEVNKRLHEVSKKEQEVGVLLPIEIKLIALADQKFDDYVVSCDNLISHLDTPDRLMECLLKIVTALQQFDILKTLVLMSAARRHDRFINLFGNYKTNNQIAIRKGFKVVVSRVNNEIPKEAETVIKSLKFLFSECERRLFSDEVLENENKAKRRNKFRFLIKEWEKILFSNFV